MRFLAFNDPPARVPGARLLLDGDSGTQTLDYLNVKDSNATGGQSLVCLTASEGCIDSGNTTNWTFAAGITGTSALMVKGLVFNDTNGNGTKNARRNRRTVIGDCHAPAAPPQPVALSVVARLPMRTVSSSSRVPPSAIRPATRCRNNRHASGQLSAHVSTRRA